MDLQPHYSVICHPDCIPHPKIIVFSNHINQRLSYPNNKKISLPCAVREDILPRFWAGLLAGLQKAARSVRGVCSSPLFAGFWVAPILQRLLSPVLLPGWSLLGGLQLLPAACKVHTGHMLHTQSHHLKIFA